MILFALTGKLYAVSVLRSAKPWNFITFDWKSRRRVSTTSFQTAKVRPVAMGNSRGTSKLHARFSFCVTIRRAYRLFAQRINFPR